MGNGDPGEADRDGEALRLVGEVLRFQQCEEGKNNGRIRYDGENSANDERNGNGDEEDIHDISNSLDQ